jgi:peptidoglycan endopeptidase LytE
MQQTYIVKRGDTLSKIAKANRTTVKKIQALNPAITNPNRIYVGQTIRIK